MPRRYGGIYRHPPLPQRKLPVATFPAEVFDDPPAGHIRRQITLAVIAAQWIFVPQPLQRRPVVTEGTAPVVEHIPRANREIQRVILQSWQPPPPLPQQRLTNATLPVDTHIPTLVERFGTTTPTNFLASSSNVPVSGKPYTIAATSRVDAIDPLAPTIITGTGGWNVTWTQRQEIQLTNDVHLTLFDGYPNSDTPGTITVDWGAVTQESIVVELVQWPEGKLVSGLQGQTPVAAESITGSPTATLLALGNSKNTVYFVAAIRGNTTLVADPGLTIIGTVLGFSTPDLTLGSCYKVGDSDLTPSMTQGAGEWGAIACEIELEVNPPSNTRQRANLDIIRASWLPGPPPQPRLPKVIEGAAPAAEHIPRSRHETQRIILESWKVPPPLPQQRLTNATLPAEVFDDPPLGQRSRQYREIIARAWEPGPPPPPPRFPSVTEGAAAPVALVPFSRAAQDQVIAASWITEPLTRQRPDRAATLPAEVFDNPPFGALDGITDRVIREAWEVTRPPRQKPPTVTEGAAPAVVFVPFKPDRIAIGLWKVVPGPRQRRPVVTEGAAAVEAFVPSSRFVQHQTILNAWRPVPLPRQRPPTVTVGGFFVRYYYDELLSRTA